MNDIHLLTTVMIMDGRNNAAHTAEPGTIKSVKLNIFFTLLLAASVIGFLFWGTNYTHGNYTLIFFIATLFGLFMAFNIGGNDVANSFGTSVGAGTLSVQQALLVAAVFEVSGAMIAGGEVIGTIREGIVDLGAMHVEPMRFVYIMMSALLAAALWLLFASRRGYPVSTTHSIVGGIVGSSIMLGILLVGSGQALSLVQWGQVGTIVLSWVISPLLGGVVSYLLYSFIKHNVLTYNDEAISHLKQIKRDKRELKNEHKQMIQRLNEQEKIDYTSALVRDAETRSEDSYDPAELETEFYKRLHAIEQQRASVQASQALEKFVPIIAALGSLIISAMLIFKGLKNLHLGLSLVNNILIMLMVAALVWMAVFIFTKILKGKSLEQSTFLLFSWMQVFTASGFAFSHGANDIANAIGPFAAIMDVLRTGEAATQAPVPAAAMLAFGVALIAGLWFIGKEVITTVGHNLTKMHPASGFSAELSAAGVVLIATIFGIPVSSTHILIGAVLGIGLVNHNANWALMKPIAAAWVITLPVAAALSAVIFLLLDGLL
ncbi:inorganic phosphate transporter [Phytohalomonas tamaricis]|uniref:inorganic phosphate transporter n=1 Tax=Phytohalomonas tamaricis TaxID=2081032 RepID=UPI0021D459E6|nr:inorganic phosphate transporter [Phytohalomonas tamaricis]